MNNQNLSTSGTYAMNIWLELWDQEFTDAQKAAKRGTRIDTTFDYELWLID